jgi:hypothetical protein
VHDEEIENPIIDAYAVVANCGNWGAFMNSQDFCEEIDKYYDQLNRNNVRPRSYYLTAFHLTTAIVLSIALLLQSIYVVENVGAQNDLTSPISNGTSGNQNVSGETEVETYIVTLKNQTSSADLDDIVKLVEEKGANVTHVYGHSINGFSVQIPADKKTEVMYPLVTDMRVNSVEPDQTMTLSPPLE